MPRPLRLLLPLFLLFAASSCSVTHVLLAVVVDGSVTFVPRNDKAAASCLYDLELVDEDRNVIWRIAAPQAGAERRSCAAFDFPLVYGRAPSGVDTLVGAGPLEDGRLYVVRGGIDFEGRLGGNSAGAFRYRVSPPAAENVEPGSREHVRLLRRINPTAR